MSGTSLVVKEILSVYFEKLKEKENVEEQFISDLKILLEGNEKITAKKIEEILYKESDI